jgi:hypothetical protein
MVSSFAAALSSPELVRPARIAGRPFVLRGLLQFTTPLELASAVLSPITALGRVELDRLIRRPTAGRIDDELAVGAEPAQQTIFEPLDQRLVTRSDWRHGVSSVE